MNNIPNYHEKRVRLTEMDGLLEEFIGGATTIDVGETTRVMLADYFYGEQLVPLQLHFTMEDRTIVFAKGLSEIPLSQADLVDGAELLGEIFWAMADRITNDIMAVSPTYSHRPNECMYRFYPDTRELVVYTPVLPVNAYPLGSVYASLAPLDGRAVITSCIGFLPQWLRAAVPSPT